ncbi:unnamed protein product [Blepharisma stoltei]|uniref:Phosphatidylinositol-specific phospholipase C X domain-containing protein n=1 Tax=Blepharisma stoltei TaxID=1481888 RepID=A0AAU9IX83_9CILI|nr:unnamed protein product [Blepharisma stoltei]
MSFSIFLFFIFLIFSLSQDFFSNWIENSLPYIENKTLKEITLPGTHDSASYFLTSHPLIGESSPWLEEASEVAEFMYKPTSTIIKNWSKCQTKNFYEQMKGGIRYFDIRAGWDPDLHEWMTHHYVVGPTVREVIRNITNFLKDFQSEIVILEISHFNENVINSTNREELRDIIIEEIGEFLFENNGGFNFTISQWIKSGKRAIITIEDIIDKNFWPKNTIFNTYANTPSINKMMLFNEKVIENYMPLTKNNELFKVSWTLTPNGETVLDSILRWKPHTLLELAEEANSNFSGFYQKMKNKANLFGNILISDNYDQSIFMPIIFEMNGIAVNKQDFLFISSL